MQFQLAKSSLEAYSSLPDLLAGFMSG